MLNLKFISILMLLGSAFAVQAVATEADYACEPTYSLPTVEEYRAKYGVSTSEVSVSPKHMNLTITTGSVSANPKFTAEITPNSGRKNTCSGTFASFESASGSLEAVVGNFLSDDKGNGRSCSAFKNATLISNLADRGGRMTTPKEVQVKIVVRLREHYFDCEQTNLRGF